MLIKTAAEMIALDVALKGNISFPAFQSLIEQAETTYIVPMIGAELYTELQTNYDASSTVPAHKNLLAKVQKCLLQYALFESLPDKYASISNSGIEQTMGENFMSASPLAYYALRESKAGKADTFAEELLTFLETKKADYPTWTTSSTYQNGKANFINTASEVNTYIPLKHSRRAFLKLKTLIPVVQDMKIASIISDAYMSSLLAGYKANTLSNDDLIVFIKCQAITAYYLAYEACEIINSMIITGDGVLTFPTFTDRYKKEEMIQGQIFTYKSKMLKYAQSYKNALIQYLTDNINLYPIYKASANYVDYSTFTGYDEEGGSLFQP